MLNRLDKICVLNRRKFMLALLFVLAPSASAKANDDDDFDLLYVTPDKFLQIWSDHKIDEGRCKLICDRVLKAYGFVAQQESWKNPELLYGAPLKFRVLDSIKSTILGYAQGPNLMVVRDSYLDDPLSQGTLAHELTHIQDARQLKGGKLPSFMLEGRALTNGHSYRLSVGLEEDSYDAKMSNSAMGFTCEEADEILSEMSGIGWNNQAMGTFLVEYMRTKWNGAGISDIHPRLSRMIGIIAGGLGFEAAFAKEFGTPFSTLLDAFKKFLDTNKAEARVQGMMWQAIAAQKQVADKDDDDDDKD